MKGAKGEKRRQELLNIAYQMFIQKGYEETSIDEIIAEAHIAKGTFYYHFPSKEATLLEAVIDMMINNEVQRAQAVLSAPLSVPQKLSIITSLRPEHDENNIADTLGPV